MREMLEIVLGEIQSSDRQMFAAYAVMFILAVVMPGWRSLGGYCIVAGGLIGWGLAYVNSLFRCGNSFDLSGPCGDGLGTAILFGTVFFAGMGLLAGALSRTAGLLLRAAQKPNLVRVAVTFIGFLVVPCYVIASSSLREWSKRLPTEACLQSDIEVELAGTIYQLPAAPLFSIYDGDGLSVYDFRVNAHQRKVCVRAHNSDEPLPITNLRIRFGRLERSSDIRVRAFCTTASDDWAKSLCHGAAHSEATQGVSAAYPIDASLYAPDEFGARYYGYRHHIDIGAGSYSRFLQEQTKATAEGNAPDRERVGIFDRHSNGYWVAHSGSWITDDGEPFTLHCSEYDGRLTCTATHGYESELHVTYRFFAATSDLEATARAVDANLAAMIMELARRD